MKEKKSLHAGELLRSEIEGAEGGEAIAEGGEGHWGAGWREKQVELLLSEAGRLEATLEEEEVGPGGGDGSCLGGRGEGGR